MAQLMNSNDVIYMLWDIKVNSIATTELIASELNNI